MLNPKRRRWFASSVAAAAMAAFAVLVWSAPFQSKPAAPQFHASDRCMACHNGLTTPGGEDFSFGVSWRPTMMANAARDPYWQAAVRRETLEHPEAAKAIEDECSICHMPMARAEAVQAGHEGAVFSHLGFAPEVRADKLAADGVSCTFCHQIGKDRLGTRESFTGGFVLDGPNAQGERPSYGPYPPDAGQIKAMVSVTGFRPAESKHLGASEACATCHTLITKALGPGGKQIGVFPEQVPYLEWQHSLYPATRSCQSCHMPDIPEAVRTSTVLGVPRANVSHHGFLGGNFFMHGLLDRHRAALKVQATAEELAGASQRTRVHLQSQTARISIARAVVRNGRLEAEVAIENLGGHKLPTAYPSRRMWVHLTVRDANQRTVFESGALHPSGAIAGNDNDADAARFEPHYAEIRSSGQVQIYEAILANSGGAVTTGLLQAVAYLKDNRMLPRGFDKKTAAKEIAVAGQALHDADFAGGSDRVRYVIDLDAKSSGPLSVEAALCFQPIGYRWAINLKSYQGEEPRRFVSYFEAAAPASMEVLARATAQSKP